MSEILVNKITAKTGTTITIAAGQTLNVLGTLSQVAGNIATAAIADDAITAAKLADNAVVQASIADDAVGAAELASSAVVTASIVDANVTLAKIENAAANTVLVRDASSSGVLPLRHLQQQRFL